MSEPGQKRKVRYTPMNMARSEIGVVWQPIRKRTGEPYGYWLHRALSLRFLQINGKQWVLALRPEFHVTSDGKEEYESSEIGAKVTHKKAHMYNQDLLSEVHFWRDFLSGGTPRIVYRCGKQALVIGSTLLQTTVEWPGVPGDHIPFRNVRIPEDLFSFHGAKDLLQGDGDEGGDQFGEDDFDEDLQDQP